MVLGEEGGEASTCECMGMHVQGPPTTYTHLSSYLYFDCRALPHADRGVDEVQGVDKRLLVDPRILERGTGGGKGGKDL